jgi:3-dehydroquinate dehydratase-1
MKPITVHGSALAGGRLPAICIPLVATTAEALLAEARAAAAMQPDLVEWRVDFFEGVAQAADTAALAADLRKASGAPLLFTRRSIREGGQPIPLDEAGVVKLYQAVCAARAADIVDMELSCDAGHLRAIRDASRAAGIELLLSFHDFGATPPVQDLLRTFRAMQQAGADIAKIAVMPRSRADVLALLQAVLQASEELAIPVAGMSMGALGAATRVCGGQFGSALTFAVGQAASAPGQIPIDALRAAIAALPR